MLRLETYKFKIKVKMKTLILVKSQHIFYMFLAVFILQSCGSRSPIIDGKVPFVVGKIVKFNETHSKYFAIDRGSGEFEYFINRTSIILPTGMYQINDTIKSVFKKK